MYEILNSCKEKLIPNFNKNSSILKNSKIFQKPQNLGFKTWKCMKLKKNLEKAWKSLEMWFGVRESDFGGEQTEVSRERSRENEVQIALVLYIDHQRFSTDRSVERCQAICWGRCREKQRRHMKLLRKCRGAKQRHKNKSSIDPPTIEKL